MVKTVSWALRRAPYAWLVATAAAMFVLLPTLADIAEPVGDGSTALAVFGAFVAASGILSWRHVRADARLDVARSDFVQWAISLAPFLLTYGLVAIGAERWVLSVGFLESLALLFMTARSIARSERTSRSA